jgi:pantetheine-phosphate adenylyltransferase
MERIAIYPGSFDPPTLGHLDLVERSIRLFDRLIVAVGENSEKPAMLDAADRASVLRECVAGLPSVEVASFRGLLVEFARERGCTTVVRGLRAVGDFEYEARVAMANRRLAPEIETVFLFTQEKYSFLASSVVREVARLGGDVRGFVPAPVARLLVERGLAKGQESPNP